MSVRSGLQAVARSPSKKVRNAVTVSTLSAAGMSPAAADTSETAARKLSAVDRCIEILSDSMAKLPTYCVDRRTRERVEIPLLQLLNVRPNEAMTPSVRKKLLEASRLSRGNSYDWIRRDPYTAEIVELIPLPGELVYTWRDTSGHVWHNVQDPANGNVFTLPHADVCQYKGASRDGITGISVLQRAAEVIAAARARQQHDLSYYENGGQPGGVLQTDTPLGGLVDDPEIPGKKVGRKDLLRREWERIHSGPTNANRIAILDYGLKYQAVSLSNKDAQFVESQEVAIRDIARYFGIPLYKLQEGKQAYSSNEQNAIEYVVSTLHPIVTHYDTGKTNVYSAVPPLYKLTRGKTTRVAFSDEERDKVSAELRGDNAARSSWYKNMREIGVFSVNDINRLEDMPDVEGGDERLASLNYVPLSKWVELSINRNGGST